jgi:RNA polymerase sigma factor (TIGR02999 family)
MEAERSEITALLRSWRDGSAGALEALVPVVYPRLRRLAAAFMRREAGDHTLDATGLVHELYLQLLQQRKASFDDREHFYSFAAWLMRLILRNWARDRRAQRRGSGAPHVPLSEFVAWVDAGSDDMLDFDRALGELERLDPRKVALLELKVFLGCSTAEAAELVGVSKATADRELQMAKAWLYRRLRQPATLRGDKSQRDLEAGF